MYNRGPPPSGPRGGNSYGSPNPHNGYSQFSQATPLGGRGHAGLGSTSYQPPPSQHHQQPPHNPSPYEPQQSSESAGGGGGEKFSLFVGNIVDGIENGWLERILQVAGPLASFKRPSPPFAFVEYSDPESVLRCLSVVNGASLKGKTGVEKSLLVKADEKTRARLDEYEKTRVLSESNSDLTLQAKDDLTSIISRISAGDAIPPSGASLSSLPSSSPHPDSQSDALSEANRLANHLRDLAPEDLPDSQRAVTMSSIAAFRERAAKKQNDKRELDRQIEERRQSMMQNRRNQQNHYGQPPLQQQAPGNSYGAGGGAQQQKDPQSYNQNVAFVKENQQAQPEPEIDDAKRERERAEMEHRQQEGIFRERERRFEQRERGRIQAWEREKIRERSIIEQEDRERTFMAERLATWDDDREAERGREPFYLDRVRWRAQRRANRQREEDFDARDRALEQQRLAAVAQHSESFLSQHADLFAESAPQSAEGEQSAGVKLSFGSTSAKPKANEPAPKRSAVLGMGEDEEEGRRKRELIPLNYSDDEDDSKDDKPKVVEKKDEGSKGGRMSSREKEKQIREIEDGVPREKDGLFGWKVKWSNLNEDILKRRISPYANKCIVGYLGGEEAELLNAVLEHLRANKPAQELVDELEPVLDDESTDLVVKVWKVLVTETELAHAGF